MTQDLSLTHFLYRSDSRKTGYISGQNLRDFWQIPKASDHPVNCADEKYYIPFSKNRSFLSHLQEIRTNGRSDIHPGSFHWITRYTPSVHDSDNNYYERIIHRLSWSWEIQRHLVFIDPLVQSFSNKLWTIVQKDSFRDCALTGYPLHKPDHTFSLDRLIYPCLASAESGAFEVKS